MSGTFVRENHPALIRIPQISLLNYRYAAITLSGMTFQTYSRSLGRPYEVHTPHLRGIFSNGFGLTYSAFARRYSRNHYCFLFLLVLKCFTSQGSPSRTLRIWESCGLLGHKRMSDSRILGSTSACD